MLVSNQRPLPCEGKDFMSWVFVGVQKLLQNVMFSLRVVCGCSPALTWVGVNMLRQRTKILA